MIRLIKKFRNSECGAITVDWVVLTALVAALASFTVIALNGATGGLGASVAKYLAEKTIE